MKSIRIPAAVAAALLSGSLFSAAVSASPAADAFYSGAAPTSELTGPMVAAPGRISAPAGSALSRDGRLVVNPHDDRSAAPLVELAGPASAASPAGEVRFRVTSASMQAAGPLCPFELGAVLSGEPAGPMVANDVHHPLLGVPGS